MTVIVDEYTKYLCNRYSKKPKAPKPIKELIKYIGSLKPFFNCNVNELTAFNDKCKSFIDTNYPNFDQSLIDIFFNYKHRRSKDKDFINFFIKSKTKVCPYCTANYIRNYKVDEQYGKSYLIGDLDHFYPKSEYKFIQLAYFNLIPCCHYCNKQKNDQLLQITNPHDMDWKRIKVKYTFDTLSLIEKYYSPNTVVKIAEDEQTSLKLKTQLNKFELIKLFEQNHQDEIADLILKKRIFSESILDQMVKLIYNNQQPAEAKFELNYAIFGYDTITKMSSSPLFNKLLSGLKEDLDL